MKTLQREEGGKFGNFLSERPYISFFRIESPSSQRKREMILRRRLYSAEVNWWAGRAGTPLEIQGRLILLANSHFLCSENHAEGACFVWMRTA